MGYTNFGTFEFANSIPGFFETRPLPLLPLGVVEAPLCNLAERLRTPLFAPGGTLGALSPREQHQLQRKAKTLAEVVHRHGVAYQGLIARLKRHPALLGGLTSHHRVVTTVRGLRLHVEAITLELLARGAALSTQERLLTNDALTLAVMEHLGVTILATNDDDFDTITRMTVYKPHRT